MSHRSVRIERSDAVKELLGLEEPIYRMRNFARLMDHFQSEEILDVLDDRNGRHFRISENVGELLGFIAAESRACAEALTEQWLAAHNAQCADERGEA